MKFVSNFLLILFSFFCLTIDVSAQAEKTSKQRLFEKVFGSAVVLDPVMVKQVLVDKPGKRFYVDSNQDGKPEEVWFIDTALRHPEKYRPVLVRVVDEDGDLKTGQEPDLDSDLYIADWRADGTVDAVLDYTDVDGDNDVDEMGMFFFESKNTYLNEDVLRIWWGRDVGDDNLLWHDIAYTYDQNLCQYRCHFGGDEEFLAFAITESGKEWIPYFENPFMFYDHDHDGVTEEVLRFSGIGKSVESIRHSFDVDNDAALEQPRDFDVSLTAYAPGAFWTPAGKGKGLSRLSLDESQAECTTIRGIPTGPFVRWSAAPRVAAPIVWERMMLTWDENDYNVDGQVFADTEERWEGVIANGNADFPQVGGPSCGPTNKRYELVMKPNCPVTVYYHPVDQRIHLRNADRAWIDVDANMDRKVDMRYQMRDANHDGFIDSWDLDADADGTIDDTWYSATDDIQEIGWNWPEINAVVCKVRKEIPEQLYALNQRLSQLLTNHPAPDVFSQEWNRCFESMDLPLKQRLLSSDETLLYYQNLLKDRMILQLKKMVDPNQPFWKSFYQARSHGDLKQMKEIIEQGLSRIPPLESYADWIKKIRSVPETLRVAWAQDWVPPNIGWESEKAAYRVYWGQFDFFGKKKPCLLYPTIGAQSYHDETEWGIDALLVGNTPGCGGVTLYVNGKAYPVWNPEGKGDIVFTKKMLETKKDQIVIEHLAAGVGPKENPYTVRFHCTALAGRQDSPIEVLIQGGKNEDKIELGIGLTKMPQESLLVDSEAGIFGTWGTQSPVIGTIGMGIVFPPQRFIRMENPPDENQVVIRAERNVPLTYHIYCDWLRGRRFDFCPSAQDWLNDLRTLAAEVKLR